MGCVQEQFPSSRLIDKSPSTIINAAENKMQSSQAMSRPGRRPRQPQEVDGWVFCTSNSAVRASCSPQLSPSVCLPHIFPEQRALCASLKRQANAFWLGVSIRLQQESSCWLFFQYAGEQNKQVSENENLRRSPELKFRRGTSQKRRVYTSRGMDRVESHPLSLPGPAEALLL